MTEADLQLAYQHAISEAHKALKLGDRRAARRWAEQAAAINPAREDAWLILAAVSSSRASIAYLDEALKHNPESKRARDGMHWAIDRLRAERPPYVPAPAPAPRKIVDTQVAPEAHVRRRSVLAPSAMAVIFVFGLLLFWFATPIATQAFNAPQDAALAMSNLIAPTATLVPSSTPLPTSTATNTPLPTATFTGTPPPTETPFPTATNTPLPPTATNTPEPTATPTDPPTPTPVVVNRPADIGPGEHWIDVDLTNQRLHAYEGDTLVRSFVVSTGTWQTPTVTGQYYVYVKYRYADMAGPGYYLANVPYVMYFYQGYGIHGTYWHNNFGTPMSHGCVNMTIEEAGWIYDFSVVGTLINVHY
jgi:lipoprotein-anchoring transpeptidase ErfK/SrfK